MGKSALLLVLLSLYGWTVTHSTRSRVYLEREDEQAMYQEKVLAREHALNGFNMVVKNTEKDFMGYRPDLNSNQYRDGSFTYTAIGQSGDTVTVLATGTVGRASYTIVGDMIQKVTAPLSALNLAGPVAATGGNGNSYLISGYDTTPGGTAKSGSGNDTFGINTAKTMNLRKESAMDVVMDGLDSDQVIGLGDPSTGSFSNGLDLDFLKSLSTEIDANAYCEAFKDRCYELPPGRYTGNQSFGTAQEPVIVTINGDCEFKGNVEGYGILRIKDGNFSTVTGTPKWEGIIFASNEDGFHELRGNPKIYGALILESTGGEMNFAIRGNAGLFYSTEALDLIKLSTMTKEASESEVTLLNVRQASADATDYVGLQPQQ